MTEIERHSYDVVVIGAGGAGLRAAIEARLQGKRTAIVCKSLFGKAHTVMAEGGAAAAMGNVNPNDNWQVHFRDTMRGGKFLNHWRMAELHAKEAPDRVWELETYGALFDRTKDGKISQRNFGGHEYPRLAHVGDRTGLEMIRTLQQKIVSLQQDDLREHGDAEAMIKVFAEATITALLKDGGPAAGGSPARSATPARTARFVVFEAPAVVLATGGIGKSFKVTSNSWEYTGDGHALAMKAGATLLNMEFVQFHPTGMVWPPSVKGILVTESVRGDGGVLKNSDGKRFMFDYVPAVFRKQYAETEEEADALVRRPGQQPAAAGAAAPRRGRPGHQLRGQGRPRLPGRRRLPRHRVPAAGRGDPQEAAVDVPPVQGAGRRRHHGRADGGRADLPLRDGRRRGRPGHRGCGRAGPVRGRRGGRRHARLEPARRQLAVRPAGLRPAGRRWARRSTSTRSAAARPAVTDRDVEAARREAVAPFAGSGGENPYAIHADLQQTMNDLVGIIRTADEVEQALAKLEELKARAEQDHRPGRQGVQPRLAPRARPAQHAHRLGVRRAGGSDPRGVARRPHPRRLPGDERRVAQGEPHLPAGRRRRRGRRSSRCR